MSVVFDTSPVTTRASEMSLVVWRACVSAWEKGREGGRTDGEEGGQ